jgi:hypothetical protein
VGVPVVGRRFSIGFLALVAALDGAGCGEAIGTGLRAHPNHDAGVDSSEPSTGGFGIGGAETGGSFARTGGAVGSGGSSTNACRDSRDCLGRPNNELICDRTSGRCVQCVAQADCDPTMTCYGNACRPACTSDRQCTPLGLLCDRAPGLCVDCVLDVDCRTGRCISGVCREVTGAGGAGSGGAAGSGGSSNGGAPSGGQAGVGGSGCSAGEKDCGGVCVRASPSNGCGTIGCTPCSVPVPPNAVSRCFDSMCDFICLSGFTKVGNACVSTTGGGGAGGTGGQGGATGGQGGATGGQGGTGGSNCAPGFKDCSGACERPSPSSGCDPVDCTPCSAPPPANGVLTCSGPTCDFICLSGFTKVGDTCTPTTGTGGAGGTGGADGTGGASGCVPASCPTCCLGAMTGCCKTNGTCGCPALCVPGAGCQ